MYKDLSIAPNLKLTLKSAAKKRDKSTTNQQLTFKKLKKTCETVFEHLCAVCIYIRDVPAAQFGRLVAFTDFHWGSLDCREKSFFSGFYS